MTGWIKMEASSRISHSNLSGKITLQGIRPYFRMSLNFSTVRIGLTLWIIA
jgi:hypothetical protein